MDNDFNPPFPFHNLRNRYPFRGERKILNLILENPNSTLRRKQGKGGKHSPSPSPFFHKRVSAEKDSWPHRRRTEDALVFVEYEVTYRIHYRVEYGVCM